MSTPIELSPEALAAFRVNVQKHAGVRAIRLGVAGGSCSGLRYVIAYDYDDAKINDIEWAPDGWNEVEQTTQQPVYFRVDKKSLLYLKDARVTWTKTLMREGFNFENPNEQSRCGCGHSFSVK